MVFSPADVTMPTTSPFSFTTGDPTELAAVAPAISNRSEDCAVTVVSRALPSFPASELPTTATLAPVRSEEHTSELQSRRDLVCRLLLEKKNHVTRHVA